MHETADRPVENRSYENQCEAPMPMGMSPKRERPSRERTKQLLDLAETIAILVEEKTHRGERCRLRRMVEMLLNEE